MAENYIVVDLIYPDGRRERVAEFPGQDRQNLHLAKWMMKNYDELMEIWNKHPGTMIDVTGGRR